MSENRRSTRKFARIGLATAALATLALGCDAPEGRTDPSTWEFPPWARKSDDLGAGLTPTRDPVVLVFDGYNHVADVAVGRNCVLPEAGEIDFASFRAGGDLLSTEFSYISSREELEEALGIDAAASIKIGPLGGGGSLGIARNYKSSEKTVTLLLRTRQLYTVVNQDRHALTDEAIDTLRSDPTRFQRECGTGYVAGVAYGAQLDVLIQIDAASIDDSKEVKSTLEANGIKAGPVSLDASLGLAFSQALAEEGVEVSVSVQGRGFVPTVDINALGALDENAFKIAAQAQEEMRTSVAHDKCNDQGEAGPGTCDGLPASGYLDNGARVAVAMGILSQPFERTANFPGDLDVIDGLLDANRVADDAVQTLREYAELYRAMVAVHNDEVGAMVASDAPYDYALYDGGDGSGAPMDASLLKSRAETWAKAYEPDNGSQVRLLADAVEDCWSRAQFGDFSDCQLRPDETELGQEVLETFAEYSSQRVRQMYYAFDESGLRHGAAASACPSGFRPPTADEAIQAWNAVEDNPDMPSSRNVDHMMQTEVGVWYDDEGAACSGSQGAWIERGTDGTFRTGCHEDGLFGGHPELVALCVPASGVFGTNVPDLPSL